MELLTSTSDLIQVVSASAGALDVHASWVDNLAGAITPGRTNTANIATAATTTVVASPAASTQRNVKGLTIANTHGSVSNFVTVQHTDGTTVEDLAYATLLPGETLTLDEGGEWHHRDVNSAEYAYNGPLSANLGIPGTLAETMPRETCPEVNSTIPTASGTLWMQAIYLKAGQTITNIILSSATTAAGTPTAGRAGLFDSNRNLLAQTADQTTTAWAANTLKTLALTATYKVPTSGLYYIGFYMTATAIITMKGGATRTATQLAGTAPIINGTSTTGLTTTLPNPAAAITVNTASLYAAVS